MIYRFVCRGPREVADPEGNAAVAPPGGGAQYSVSRTVSGTMKTDVGNSAFYSKVTQLLIFN